MQNLRVFDVILCCHVRGSIDVNTVLNVTGSHTRGSYLFNGVALIGQNCFIRLPLSHRDSTASQLSVLASVSFYSSSFWQLPVVALPEVSLNN
jgi:hypothetical protein